MNIFIDLDNTLCSTNNSDYENSKPIIERINKVNKLKEEGNYITIWTARGSKSGLDHTELTKKQLIGIIEKADKPDSIQKFNELSQSKKYELLNSAINYETKNPDLFNAMEIAIFES